MNATDSSAGGRCHRPTAERGPSLFQNGNLVFQAHHVGWILTGVFTIIATIASFWLINKHLQWYTNRREQRYIVRLLFMVPIYAIISLVSYLFWNHSTPLILIRDGYESTALTAFFYLLLTYLSPDPEEQKMEFTKAGLSCVADRKARQAGKEPKRWMFPLGFVRWKPADGLYFLQLMKWGVLQYCVIRPTTTLAAVILDYAGLYCEESWGLGWGHIYIVIIVSSSVTIAMYCLLQLYVAVSEQLAPHKPLLKLFAIKAVVFLTFWQATFLSLLSMFGVVKNTQYMTAEDINIGIGALLETFEMVLFAFLHIRAFTYRVYRPSDSIAKRTPRLRSLGHAMDFRETLRELWTGCIYFMDKFRGKEPKPDKYARRMAHYQEAFGKSRPTRPIEKDNAMETAPQTNKTEVEVEQHVDIDIEGERQWLGLGGDYCYGLEYVRREKSDSLHVQIEKELRKLGYQYPMEDIPESNSQSDHGKQRSWWRSIYRRISHANLDEDELHDLNPRLSRKHKRSSLSRGRATRRKSRDHTSYDREQDTSDLSFSASIQAVHAPLQRGHLHDLPPLPEDDQQRLHDLRVTNGIPSRALDWPDQRPDGLHSPQAYIMTDYGNPQSKPIEAADGLPSTSHDPVVYPSSSHWPERYARKPRKDGQQLFSQPTTGRRSSVRSAHNRESAIHDSWHPSPMREPEGDGANSSYPRDHLPYVQQPSEARAQNVQSPALLTERQYIDPFQQSSLPTNTYPDRSLSHPSKSSWHPSKANYDTYMNYDPNDS